MTIPAQYGNGHSARRHAVTLASSDGFLYVAGEYVAAQYPLSGVRLTEPFAHAASILYFDDGAHCEVDGAHYPALAAMLGQRASLVVRAQREWRMVLASIGMLIAVIGAGAVWGLPIATVALTALLPQGADMRIGEISRDALTRQRLLKPSTLSAVQQADIAQVWNSVQPARPRMPMTLIVRAMPIEFGPNALALPDGTIILNDAMVQKILRGAPDFAPTSSAALAGVLSHEIGHIEGRHSMLSVVRASLTTACAAYLFGDFSAVAAGAPAVLLGARHSRTMEADADAYAIAALQARHLPLEPLADLFRFIDSAQPGDKKQAGWIGNAASYLASHPGSAERAERLRAADSTGQ